VAARLLAEGKLVAVPTETVYGLAADSLNQEAVEAIYRAKGRAENKPLSVLLTDMAMVETVCCEIPEAAYRLAEAFLAGAPNHGSTQSGGRGSGGHRRGRHLGCSLPRPSADPFRHPNTRKTLGSTLCQSLRKREPQKCGCRSFRLGWENRCPARRRCLHRSHRVYHCGFNRKDA